MKSELSWIGDYCIDIIFKIIRERTKKSKTHHSKNTNTHCKFNILSHSNWQNSPIRCSSTLLNNQSSVKRVGKGRGGEREITMVIMHTCSYIYRDRDRVREGERDRGREGVERDRERDNNSLQSTYTNL